MILVVPLLALLAATLLVAIVLRLVLRAFGRRPARYWRRAAAVVVLLVPLHAFVTIPALLGFVGSRMVDTRPDEAFYRGPILGPDGRIEFQERTAGRPPPADDGTGHELAVTVEAEDGVPANGFLLPPLQEPPALQVVMVHGLFRNAMELEPVAEMFRRQGAEVLLLELRNHGGSARTAFTFGLREADDVVAAAELLRARRRSAASSPPADLPLVLYGVSLGTAPIALAAPRIAAVDAVVLDAPMDDLLLVAHRMLGGGEGNTGRRTVALVEPFRSLTLRAVELWSGFEMAEVRPLDALASLPAEVRVLLIGGSEDRRMPPSAVQSIYDALPMPETRRELWIRDGSGHGRVWSDDPDGYEQRIAELVAAVVGGEAR